MTTPARRYRLFDVFAFLRRSSAEQQNTAARPATLQRDRLSIALCFGAIAIGIIALTGYVLGNASIAALSASGKPVSALTALALIVLGAGLHALRSAAPAGLLTARRAALVVVVVTAADLLWAALSPHIEEWRVWAARGGVLVHPYFITELLFLASASALLFITTRRDFAGHVIASIVLLISALFLFGDVLKVPSFLDPAERFAPVPASIFGLGLISAAALLARPRGWVVPLLSRTLVGRMLRLLLPAAVAVPFAALGLRNMIEDMPGFTPEVGLTVIVVVNVCFGVVMVLGAGVILHKHDSDRARLAAIVESSDDAIIGTSSDGLIETWNAGADLMYGYRAAEAVGRSVTMLAPPERHDEALRVLERIRRGERIDPVETVRVAKDGRRIDVWLSVSPILDDEGRLAGVSSIAHDITGRKKTEEAVVKSEARYRTLVENLPQKIFLKDRNSVYVSVNEAYARDLGIEPKAVAGKTDYDFFPEDLAGKYRADDARIMRAGVTENLDEEYIEGGQRGFIHTVKTPVKDSQGNVTSILGILWDITEKKLAEEKLKTAMAELERSNRDLARSEAALKEAQRIAHVGHWESSIVTGAVTWSDEHYRILGIPIGSVTPSHELLLGMMDPRDRRRQEDAFARALASSADDDADADADTELRVTTPAGDALVLSQCVFADRNAAGNVVGFHGTIQDITQRVATEQALRDSEAALAEAQQIAQIGSAIVYPETGEINASDEYFRIFDLEPRPSTPISAFLDRVHKEDRGAVQAALTAAVSSGKFNIEFRILCGDGSIRFAHGIARRQQNESRVVSLIGTVENMTERKLAEDALRQRSESLERSNAELERFNRAAVGRELRMIELKRQINDLSVQSGQPAPYVLPDESALARETS